MSVVIDMDKPERCGVCPLRSGARCVMHDVLYFDWSDEHANCPLRPAQDRERWIPVAERLPPLDTDVLVFSHGNISVCALIRLDARTADMAWEDDYGFWDDEEGVAAVTRWMPLPEPPKEEEECP